MLDLHVSVLHGWRQICQRLPSPDLQQALAGSLRSAQPLAQPEVLAALAEYCLACQEVSDVEWLLTSTSVSKYLNRSAKAALVLNYPSLSPSLAPSLDQLPIIAEFRKRDLAESQKLSWILSNLSSVALTNSFNDIMAILTRLLNSHQTDHKHIALSAFQLILREIDLPVLRWQSGLILELLKREVQLRDAKYEDVAVETYIQALSRLLPRQRPRGSELTSAIDLFRREIVYLALGGTYPTTSSSRSIVFLRALRKLFALAGTESVIYLKAFLPALFVFLENERDDVKQTAISALEMLMRVCWPQVPTHCGKLFEGICHAMIKHQVNEGSEDTFSSFIGLLSLLRELSPERFGSFASACATVDILSDVMQRIPAFDSSQKGPDSLLYWDNINIYC